MDKQDMLLDCAINFHMAGDHSWIYDPENFENAQDQTDYMEFVKNNRDEIERASQHLIVDPAVKFNLK